MNSDRQHYLARRMADRAAEDEIRKPERLQELSEQYEVWPYDELARMLANLGDAIAQLSAIYAVAPQCNCAYAIEAILTAIDQYRRRALAKQSDLMLEECDEAITENA